MILVKKVLLIIFFLLIDKSLVFAKNKVEVAEKFSYFICQSTINQKDQYAIIYYFDSNNIFQIHTNYIYLSRNETKKREMLNSIEDLIQLFGRAYYSDNKTHIVKVLLTDIIASKVIGKKDSNINIISNFNFMSGNPSKVIYWEFNLFLSELENKSDANIYFYSTKNNNKFAKFLSQNSYNLISLNEQKRQLNFENYKKFKLMLTSNKILLDRVPLLCDTTKLKGLEIKSKSDN